MKVSADVLHQVSIGCQEVLLDERDLELFNTFKWMVVRRKHLRYLARTTDNALFHRLVMDLEKGDPRVVDHIDGNPLNNLRSNLRVVTQRQNSINRHIVRGASRYRGVSRHRDGGWTSRITVRGRAVYLGLHKTELGAAAAYNRVAARAFGPFVQLNRIPGWQ